MWDDSGSYAVVTEQRPSASQFMAAKVLDVIARPPGCEGQAADAVSAYTQVRMEDAPKLLKIPRSQNVQRYGFNNTNGKNHGENIEDPVVPLERNLYGHPLAGLLWERQFEEVLLERGWRKVPTCEMAGKKLKISPMWKKLMKNVDLDEPTSFLDHVYLGCTQRLLMNTEECVNHEFLLQQLKKLPGWEKTSRKDGCVVQRYGRTCSKMR